MARNATSPYRVGIVGVKGASGGIGGSHTHAAKRHPKTRLAAICDVNPAGCAAFREQHGPVDAYTDITAMFDAQSIDIACIGTSDHTHCELVEAACRAGVPMIFCEKPLDVTLERGDRMARAVAESGATFLCDHTRRWMPTWVRAKQMLEEIGPVVRARAHMGGPRAMLFRNGTHLIDTLCWFVGDEPAWLVGGEFEDLGVFDPNPSPTALLGFRNGCRAFIDLSKKSPGEFEIDCVCDGGRLTVNRAGIHLTREAGAGAPIGVGPVPGRLGGGADSGPTPDHLASLGGAPSGGAGTLGRAPGGAGLTTTDFPPDATDSDGMVFAMRDLIDAYEEGHSTCSTVRDALRVLEVITAIVRSHDQGGARVTWPLDRAATTASEGRLGLDASTLRWRKP